MSTKEIGEREFLKRIKELVDEIADARLGFDEDASDIPISEHKNIVVNVDTFVRETDWLPGMTEAQAGRMTAVMASDAYPFLQSGQLSGLIGGLKGAAEYEQLINHRDRAFIGMDAQSITHILIVIFIIFGNISFFL